MRFVVSILTVFIMRTVIFSSASDVIDLSDVCKNGRKVNNYLTTGLETSDISVAMIANDGKLNCSLMYFVNADKYLMAVVEYPDWASGKPVCTKKRNFVRLESDRSATDICKTCDYYDKPSYREIRKHSVTLYIYSEGDMNTIKITVTSMRHSGTVGCQDDKEISCPYKFTIYCMTRSALCDSNANCGLDRAYDEDKDICHESKLTPGIVLFTIVMLIVSLWLILSMAIAILPKRKETFVYQWDQQMSLFDDEWDKGTLEISIQIVFPEEGNYIARSVKSKGKQKSKVGNLA